MANVSVRLGRLKEKSFDIADLRPLKEIKELDHLVLKYVYRALVTCGWNRTHTAKRLGISIRTLRNYLKIYSVLGCKVSENPTARVSYPRKKCCFFNKDKA